MPALHFTPAASYNFWSKTAGWPNWNLLSWFEGPEVRDGRRLKQSKTNQV